MDKLNLIQAMALKDIESFYDKIIENKTSIYEKSLMGMLSYIKEKELFDSDFFEYWFVKLLNAPVPIGCFYLDEPNYKIFGFDEKNVGKILQPHLLFLQNACCYKELSEMLTHALNNGCFLNVDFFNLLTLQMVTEEDKAVFKEKSIFNASEYLQKTLSQKFDEVLVKI